MKTYNKNTITLLFLALIFMSGCKEQSSEKSSASTSTPELVTDKTNNSGCKVESVDGGAKIICGDTSALISNGAPGSPGTNGSNQVMPRLIIGGAESSYGPEAQVGDYVISVTKSKSGLELITVWASNVDAIAQFENGIIHPIVNAVYFNSADCSGDAMYPVSANDSLVGVMGDRLILLGNSYFKLSHIVEKCNPQSKKLSDGTCVAANAATEDFRGFKATVVSPNITTVLPPGYRIKVR